MTCLGLRSADAVTPQLSREELQRARQRVGRPEWQAAAETMRRAADRAMDEPEDLPEFDASWYDADPQRDYRETYLQFHTYMQPAYRYSGLAARLLQAGLVFDEQRYLDRACRWAFHFADQIKFHVRHFDSGLSYAGVGCVLAGVAMALGERFGDDDTARLERAMTACGEAIDTSISYWLSEPTLQRMPYNNHFPRQRHGLACLGLALGRDAWVRPIVDGPKGFGEILAGATMDDGLCYESSMLYHFGTANALAEIAEIARHHPALGVDLWRETFADGRTLKQMFDAPLGLMFPNGEPPAAGDCYAVRKPMWEHRAAAYEVVYAACGDPRHAWLIVQGGQRNSAAALLHGAERLDPVEAPMGRSRLWIEHGYAMVSSRAGRGVWDGRGVVGFLAGDRSGVHHHRDALHAAVFAGGHVWTDDAEVQSVEEHAFSSAIQEDHNRTMLAHNVVVVDEQDQQELARTVPITEWKILPACRTVTMTDTEGRITPGVARARSLAVTDDYCLDVYQVNAGEGEHTLDWVVHPRADGPVRHAVALAPATLPERMPYAMLRDAAAGAFGEGGATLGWSQGEAAVRLDVCAGLPGELIRAEWPQKADWSTGGREVLMLRVRAARADFVALCQVEGQAALWRIARTERRFNGLHDEVHVEVTDGVTTRWHVFGGV